jgi:protein O-mannosyl-transferase
MSPSIAPFCEDQDSRLARFLPWALFLLVLLAFLPALHNEFIIYDDSGYVYDNPRVRNGISWDNLRWAFGSRYYSNWHPLTWISHMVDCQVFGLTPWGHHFTNVLLHAINAALLFALLRRLTCATWRSAMAAALFALHPLRVESVGWVAERKDVLCAFFFMLTLLSYVRFITGQKAQSSKARIFYSVSLVFFALGLMSKAMIVTLPFVLLLLDYWPLQRLRWSTSETEGAHTAAWGGLVAEKLPFFLLAAVSSVVTFFVQKEGGAVRPLRLDLRLENAVVACCRYIGKLLCPINLSIFYPYQDPVPAAEWLLAAAFLLGASVLVIYFGRRREYLPVGWFWFLGMLVPVIGLVQVGGQSMADRYTYLPEIGLAIILVWGGWDLATQMHAPRWGHVVGQLTTLGLLLISTEHQLAIWRNSETLFRHAVAVTDHNGPAHGILGVALEEKQQNVEAEKELREALALEPNDPIYHYRLGKIMLNDGRLEPAIEEFQTSLRLKPGLQNANMRLGEALARAGRVAEAIESLQIAAALEPADANVHNLLGGALAASGRLDDGISQLNEALRLNPDLAGAHNNLSRALDKQGHLAEAIEQSELAVKFQPNDPDFHNNLGTSLAKAGRLDEAADQFRETLALKPGEVRAALNLAAVSRWKSSAAPAKASGEATARRP